MQIIGINTGVAEIGVNKFKKSLEALSRKDDVVYARIRYKSSHFSDSNEHPLLSTLVVYTTDNMVFCLADVTAGNSGNSSKKLVELLKYLDFEFNENDILQSNEEVQLDLLKDGYVLKGSFRYYDILHYEYLTRPFMKKKY